MPFLRFRAVSVLKHFYDVDTTIEPKTQNEGKLFEQKMYNVIRILDIRE